jgi:homocysteine S-methyltransferase
MTSSRSSLGLALSSAAAPLLLDGGLSTELERRGHDISGQLWSAVLLRDAPDAVVAAHTAFLRAGAQVLTTASYQASPEGFARAGIDPGTGVALLRRSVHLTRRAADGDRDGDAWVAGSVGPYGAMLADGSEYTGEYGGADLARLRRFHRPRLEILAEAGADVLAAETVPSMLEAEALVVELDRLAHPSWLSLTTTIDDAGTVRTRRGELAREAFALARDVDSIIAVGVNCTDPAGLTRAISIAAEASGKPVVAYPNSGEGWDARNRTWTGSAAAGFDASAVRSWQEAGARLIGGCCRVGPEMIAELAAHRWVGDATVVTG